MTAQATPLGYSRKSCVSADCINGKHLNACRKLSCTCECHTRGTVATGKPSQKSVDFEKRAVGISHS